MKHSLVLTFFFVLMFVAGCGSDAADVETAAAGTPDPSTVPATTTPSDAPTATPGASATPGPTVTPGPTPTTPPAATPQPRQSTQRDALAAARAAWQANRPATYSFTYRLQCECDQGPWKVDVDADGNSTARHLFDDLGGGDAPYRSIEDIFDEIEATLDEGRSPVDVDYDELGLPREYIFNEPELPVDGGFIVVIDEFVANAVEQREADREALEAAITKWDLAGITSYTYTYRRNCFCPPEFVGPYEVSVVDGVLVGATLDGVDLFDVDLPGSGAYAELILTVDEVFDEVERAIDDAHSYTVEYNADSGHPTTVFIDWVAMMADEEIGYEISDLVAGETSCSTDAATVALKPQTGLPAAVAARRSAIFDAAMACDIDGLVALTNPSGFVASFGGGGATELWRNAEARGEPVLLDLVRHLNLAFAVSSGGGNTFYIWPSAFEDLEAPDGTGLDSTDYEALLELYPVEELRGMFEGLGSYVGYRVGIDAQGNWLYFVAGD